MEEFVSARDFSGVVLVARKGQVLFQKAYSLANSSKFDPLRTNRAKSLFIRFHSMAEMSFFRIPETGNEPFLIVALYHVEHRSTRLGKLHWRKLSNLVSHPAE